MNIILGITGSVASKLALTIKKNLKNFSHEVKTVATERSLFFIPPRDIEELAPLRDKCEWPESGYYKKGDPVPHIDLCQWAELLLIAPLSADTLADITNGKADKFLTSIARAWPTGHGGPAKPFIIAPAMNSEMWLNPITEWQIKILEKRYKKFKCVYPVIGNLACGGQPAIGAMAQIETIIKGISDLLKQ